MDSSITSLQILRASMDCCSFWLARYRLLSSVNDHRVCTSFIQREPPLLIHMHRSSLPANASNSPYPSAANAQGEVRCSIHIHDVCGTGPGTPSYELTASALARVNSFIRPAQDIREATLAGAVLAAEKGWGTLCPGHNVVPGAHADK